MIILDTNVISEALKPSPNRSVQEWLNRQAAESLYLSSITLAELLFGMSILPEGKRKRALVEMMNGLLVLFKERILSFDATAAHYYAELATTARLAGKGFPAPDGYIAATAAAHGFAVATRDTGPFEAVGLAVVNPWEVHF